MPDMVKAGTAVSAAPKVQVISNAEKRRIRQEVLEQRKKRNAALVMDTRNTWGELAEGSSPVTERPGQQVMKAQELRPELPEGSAPVLSSSAAARSRQKEYETQRKTGYAKSTTAAIRREIADNDGTWVDGEGGAAFLSYKNDKLDKEKAELREVQPTMLESAMYSGMGAVKQAAGYGLNAVILPLAAAEERDTAREIEDVQTEADQLSAWLEDAYLTLEGCTDPDEAKRLSDTIEECERQLEADRERLEELSGPRNTFLTGVQSAADKLVQSGAEDIEWAKSGREKEWGLFVDTAVALTQMGMDSLTGGVVPMVIRGFGAAAAEGRAKGYSVSQQVALGLAGAATEYFTEKLFGGNKVYDGEALGLIPGVVDKLCGNKKLVEALSSAPAEKLYEGFEEMVSTILNPIFESIVTGKYEPATAEEVIHDGAVGLIVAMAAGGMGASERGRSGRGDADADTKLLPAPTGADTKLLPAPSGTDTKLLPAATGTDTRLLPAPAGTDTRLLPAAAGTDTKLLPAPAGTDTRLLPAAAGTDTKLLPAAAGTDTKLLPAPAGTDTKLLPAPTGTDTRLLYVPTSADSGVWDAEWGNITNWNAAGRGAAEGATNAAYQPGTAPFDARQLLLRPSGTDTKLLPAATGADTRLLPAATGADTKLLPAPTSADTRLLPAPTGTDTKLLPAATGADTRLLPASSGTDTRLLYTPTSADSGVWDAEWGNITNWNAAGRGAAEGATNAASQPGTAPFDARQLLLRPSGTDTKLLPAATGADTRLLPAATGADTRLLPAATGADTKLLPAPAAGADTKLLYTPTSADSGVWDAEWGNITNWNAAGRGAAEGAMNAAPQPGTAPFDARQLLPAATGTDTKLLPAATSADTRLLPAPVGTDTRLLPAAADADPQTPAARTGETAADEISALLDPSAEHPAAAETPQPGTLEETNASSRPVTPEETNASSRPVTPEEANASSRPVTPEETSASPQPGTPEEANTSSRPVTPEEAAALARAADADTQTPAARTGETAADEISALLDPSAERPAAAETPQPGTLEEAIASAQSAAAEEAAAALQPAEGDTAHADTASSAPVAGESIETGTDAVPKRSVRAGAEELKSPELAAAVRERAQNFSYGREISDGEHKAAMDMAERFIAGDIEFSEAAESYAVLYAEAVRTNKRWKWGKEIPGGKGMSRKDRKAIKSLAVSMGLLPDVKTRVSGLKRYVTQGFREAGASLCEIELPKELWNKSDRAQFEWLNEQIGGKIDGMVWHHSEETGIMVLVPFGLHNITGHAGGRAPGEWCFSILGRLRKGS